MRTAMLLPQNTHGWEHPLLIPLQYSTNSSSHHPKSPQSPPAPHNHQLVSPEPSPIPAGPQGIIPGPSASPQWDNQATRLGNNIFF